jgi:hypothetical protein
MDDELYVAFEAEVTTTSNDPTIAPDGDAYNISAQNCSNGHRSEGHNVQKGHKRTLTICLVAPLLRASAAFR